MKYCYILSMRKEGIKILKNISSKITRKEKKQKRNNSSKTKQDQTKKHKHTHKKKTGKDIKGRYSVNTKKKLSQNITI